MICGLSEIPARLCRTAVSDDGRKEKNAGKQSISPKSWLPCPLVRMPQNSPNANFLTKALKTGIASTNFDAVRQEYSERSATGEFSNSIKNDADRSLSREAKQETGKGIAERKAIEPAAKEIGLLSMDALENSVRQKVIVENEISQSIELLIGI